MAVTVNTTLAGPLTARFSNIYGALANLGLVSSLGAQDVTGSGDPVAPILNASQFYAPLTSSLILTRGTGNPTYTRATAAWEFDNEGKLVTVPSGAARFGGERMVRNLLTYTEDLTYSVYTSVNVTKTTNSLTRSSNAVSYVTHAITGGLVGATYSVRCKAKAKSTGNIVALRLQGSYPNRVDAMFDLSSGTVFNSAGSTYTLNSATITGPDSDDYYTLNLVATTVTSALAGVVMGPADSSLSIGGWEASSAVLSDCYVKEFQLENVTGQADQTASEYVSVGVLSAPYHGAGVDGVKWFNTNKDGSTISASSLLGYHAEGARTNSLLYSRDLTNAAWVKTNATAAKTATGIDNAPNSASILTAGAADATILQTLTMAAAARSFSAYVKRRTGSGSVYITRNGGTNWTDITSSLGASWTRVKIENTSVLNPSVGFKIATSGDEIDVDVCQDEAGAMASSPIVTTTAAVTRNGDRLLYAKAGNLADAAGSALASWCIDSGETTYGSSSRNALVVDANGRVLYGTTGGNVGNGGMYDGTSSVHSTGATARNNKNHVKNASKWSGVSMSVVNGSAAMATAAYDGTMGAGASIDVGGNDSGANQYGYIKNVYIWSTALTDEQLQQVTS